MHISGTFLNSKIAQRIALILFLAAFIPTVLITTLTNSTVDKLVANHAHKELVEVSHNYGLSVFANLLFARTSLMMISDSTTTSQLALQKQLDQKKYAMFDALLIMAPEGGILDHTVGAEKIIETPHKSMLLAALKSGNLNKAKLLVLPASAVSKPKVVLILRQIAPGKRSIVAEINPRYLWGDPADYSTEMRLCAYRIGNANNQLFCSSDKQVPFKGAKQPENIGDWELFLRGEFDDGAWRFVSQRLRPSTARPLGDFLNSYGYIGAAVFSLLVVALLSLIQIRKTMVPLEQLIEGTKNISRGKFTQVRVDGNSEFADLANSFNGMSANIKRQLDTLQSLSMIDQEMTSNLDVNKTINQIIARIQTLLPSTIICVMRLDEESEQVTQCSISISDKISLISPRVAITNQEMVVIQSYGSGRFSRCEKESTHVHKHFLSQLNASYCWIFPIFWQGEMCAFISIADEVALAQDSTHWPEITELAGRISIAISTQRREDQLLIQAQYDTLTGLPNRILLQDRIRQAIDRSDRSGEDFWLIFIDLDRFKYINDSLGHQAGDQLLSEVAKRLEWTIRDTDTVARFGGDEFIIIMHGEKEDSLKTGTLNRMVKAIEAPFTFEGNEIVITCSAGVSVYPTDTRNADVLLSNADIAMYRAKELGKNNFQFFTKSMNEKVAERLRLETHLRKALELNELEMFYQPKVSLLTNKIVGMEALMRWNSKALGFISPAQFIPLAEETGLIIPIGEWALKTACTQAVAWRNAGLGPLVMAVNLSVRQFSQINLIKSITGIIRETGIDPQQLELELTESMIMQNTDSAMRMLQKIKTLGIHLSIDDFGTGYSSLAYLKNLPVSTLKIDKSFIDDIILHNDEAPIVASIISLAKNLKLNVVAEGVETYDQVKYLSAHGCNEIQGYYFSKPAPAKTIETLLRSEKKLEAPHLKLVESLNKKQLSAVKP